jgi:hypothetical protein
MGVLEEAPRQDGIDHVFDGRFPRIDDTGQVEMPVRLDNQAEVPGGSGNGLLTIRQIAWKKLGQFLSKGHVFP